MNRSHHVTKAAARARSSKAASIRQTLLDSDDLNEEMEAPWAHALSDNEEDWPELESDTCDVETEIGLLLNGVR
jgi:hypothetical protein